MLRKNGENVRGNDYPAAALMRAYPVDILVGNMPTNDARLIEQLRVPPA